MLSRYLMIFGAVVLVSACATKDEVMVEDAGMVSAESTVTDQGPLGEIYDDGSQGPQAGTQADLVVNVGDRVFFGTDRHDLSGEARTMLDAQANWLQQYPNLGVTIEGHADERGTREYNLALGERRANSAKNYLIALGVAPSRITTLSYGKERPAVPGSNETAWAQNRRAVTQVD